MRISRVFTPLKPIWMGNEQTTPNILNANILCLGPFNGVFVASLLISAQENKV
jgi:hypothetical protein